MSTHLISDVNIESFTPIPTPGQVKHSLPQRPGDDDQIYAFRRAVCDILDGADPRLLLVVGPCSIHNIDAALEYAGRLRALAAEVEEHIFIVMRVYFEKPRTTGGWKGIINDPFMDDSFRIDRGLVMARELLRALLDMGLPAGTEALDTITPQYIGDLVTWTAIGARTAESQTHREMASGLSTPVGFKNGTDGGIEAALNALESASRPHHFLGITQEGYGAVFHTRGNPHGHIVLRGGPKPNYDPESIARCMAALQRRGLRKSLMVDCSHANSGKDPARQEPVAADCLEQIMQGNRSLVGLMLESNLEWGRQDMGEPQEDLKPGVSITDACIDWPTTERIVRHAHERLAHRAV